MIVNPENVCKCGAPKTSKARSCHPCSDPTPLTRVGRRAAHDDDAILTAIELGCDTFDALLDHLGLVDKTSLAKRVRNLHARGLVDIVVPPRNGARVPPKHRVVSLR